MIYYYALATSSRAHWSICSSATAVGAAVGEGGGGVGVGVARQVKAAVDAVVEAGALALSGHRQLATLHCDVEVIGAHARDLEMHAVGALGGRLSGGDGHHLGRFARHVQREQAMLQRRRRRLRLGIAWQTEAPLETVRTVARDGERAVLSCNVKVCWADARKR